MKKAFIISVIIITVSIVAYIFRSGPDKDVSVENLSVAGRSEETVSAKKDATQIVAENLKIPWELVFLSDGSMFVTERPGTLRKLGDGGFSLTVPGVEAVGEGGLLGMVLHPDFSQNNWIYLYHTARSGSGIKNVVERYRLSGNELSDRTAIVDNIPAGSNHDGGRLAFGPDGYLYVTTGDSGNSGLSQDKNSLAGKILRVRDDGSIPEDNPYSNAVYSYGHRNVQGIAWDGEGRLWATEHGRSGVLSGYDELNLIKKGANYGWPSIQGNESRSGMETPVINSGPSATWAPSGMAYRGGSIFFVGLRGQALYEYRISEDRLAEHLKGEFGRIRDIVAGPDGNFYILTNNTDGRGTPRQGDDKIIKIVPDSF